MCSAGLAWMATTSTLVSELQLVLPIWGRARGLAIYAITFAGSQAAGALIWGLVANQVGVQLTVLLAAVVLLAGVIAGMVWRVPQTGHLDPRPANIYWVDPRLAFDPEPETGPVMVQVEFTIEPERYREQF
jgi:Transmembrane secretion effector